MITDRRLTVVALAAVLTAPALAGCLGSAQASAMEQESAAEDRAQEWDGDAQLAFVFGVEGDFAAMGGNWSGSWGWSGGSGSWGGSSWDSGWSETPSRSANSGSTGEEAETQQSSSCSDGYWDRAKEDDSRGDGETIVWLYIYVSPNKPGKSFVVAVEDGEIREACEEENEDDMSALGEWSVDSDEAAEIAVENNDGIQAASESEDHSFFYILEDEDDHPNPAWGVAAVGGDESGGGGGWVQLDAETGEVLESEGGSYSR